MRVLEVAPSAESLSNCVLGQGTLSPHAQFPHLPNQDIIVTTHGIALTLQ